jgi:hypothetical protein
MSRPMAYLVQGDMDKGKELYRNLYVKFNNNKFRGLVNDKNANSEYLKGKGRHAAQYIQPQSEFDLLKIFQIIQRD